MGQAFRILIFALLLATTLPLAHANFIGACRNAIYQLLAPGSAKSKDPLLQVGHPLLAKFRAKVQTNTAELRGVSVLDDMAWLQSVEHFTESEFRELFRYGDRWITPRELEARWDALGAVRGLGSYEDNITAAYKQWMTGKNPAQAELQKSFEQVLTKYRAAAAWDPVKRKSVRDELTRRQAMATIEEFYNRAAFYRVELRGDRVKFPDGAVYRVLRTEKNGDLVLSVPYSHIIRTQDYLNPSIVSEYMNDASLKKMVFDGLFLPDGRVLIFDQHHRTVAYHNSVSAELPFTLKRDPGASTYSVNSHLYLLKFLTLWMGLDDVTRGVFLRQARSTGSLSADEALEPMRELYYRLTRFPRIEGETFSN